MNIVFSSQVLNSVSLEQIAEVVEGRMQRPERRVVRRVPRPVELVVRPERGDRPSSRTGTAATRMNAVSGM